MRQVVVDQVFWSKFFHNKRTKKVLRRLAAITNRTGHETSVDVDIDARGICKFTNPCEGGCITIGPDARVIADLDEYEPYMSYAEFFSFHFHPEDHGSIRPSIADLDLFDYYPIIAVGQVKHTGEIRILIMKARAPLKQRSNRKPLESALYATDDQAEIIQVLTELGYQAAVVSVGDLRKQWRVSAEDLVQLGSFTLQLAVPSVEEMFAAAEKELRANDLI